MQEGVDYGVINDEGPMSVKARGCEQGAFGGLQLVPMVEDRHWGTITVPHSGVWILTRGKGESWREMKYRFSFLKDWFGYSFADGLE